MKDSIRPLLCPVTEAKPGDLLVGMLALHSRQYAPIVHARRIVAVRVDPVRGATVVDYRYDDVGANNQTPYTLDYLNETTVLLLRGTE